MTRPAALLAFGIASLVFGLALASLGFFDGSDGLPVTEVSSALTRLGERLDDIEERLEMRRDEPRISPATFRTSPPGPEESRSKGTRQDDPEVDRDEPAGDAIEGLIARLDTIERRLEGLEEDPVNRGYNYLDSDSAELRRQGILALERIAEHDPEARLAIRQKLLDPDPRVRQTVLDTIADIGDKEAAQDVVALLGDADENVRREAINTLTRLDAEGSGPAIAGLLQDESADVRAQAADSLGKLKSKESAALLVSALSDSSERVRGQAISSIGEVHATTALPVLRNLYEENPGEHRIRLVQALRNLGDNEPFKAEVTRLSQSALSAQSESERREAIRMLSWFAPKEAAETFTRALEDANSRVRYEAQRALRAVRDSQNRGRGRGRRGG